MNSPTVTLSNGLTVANFSSPHPFNFTTGEVLPACDSEWANEMKLDIEEIEYGMPKSFQVSVWTDVELNISIPPNVAEALHDLNHDDDIDIVLVPFMVLQAMKEYLMINKVAKEPFDIDNNKCRVIRVADRITKEIYPDKFCI